MVQQLWKTGWRFLKNKFTISPSNPASGYIPKITESRVSRDICTPVLTAALLVMAKMWKQPKCPSMDERVSKVPVQ